jgi:hypothetical protein
MRALWLSLLVACQTEGGDTDTKVDPTDTEVVGDTVVDTDTPADTDARADTDAGDTDPPDDTDLPLPPVVTLVVSEVGGGPMPWVELHNPTGQPVSLDGLRFVAGTSTSDPLPAGPLAGGAYVVVGRDGAAPDFATTTVTGTVDLAVATALWDAHDRVVDAWTTPAPEASHSWETAVVTDPNDTVDAWVAGTCTIDDADSLGTPGRAFEDCPLAPRMRSYVCPPDGHHVPADHPTLDDAIAAVDQIPGGGTICLGAGVHSEALDVWFTEQPIVVQGVSAADTILEEGDHRLHANDVFTLQGLTIRDPILATGNQDFLLQDLVLLDGIDVGNNYSYRNEVIRFERCDITTTTASRGIDLSPNSASPAFTNVFDVTIRNSWIHDVAGPAIYVPTATGDYPDRVNVLIEHNTITNAQTGVLWAVGGGGGLVFADLAYNLFAGNDTAYRVSTTFYSRDHQLDVDSAYNAYSGNLADHDTSMPQAQPGFSDLVVDCQLDAATPPVPAAGGPCVDVPGSSATEDLYGLPRDATPDIGAVER